MGLCANGRRELVIPVDPNGNAVAVVFDGVNYRLAVDAAVVLPPLASVAINDEGAGATELSVKAAGVAVTGGSALVGAQGPTGLQQNLRVDAGGNLLVTPADVAPGTVITSGANTAIGIGATVALPVPPAGTRSMVVQNLVSTSQIKVRELGGPAGTGILLFFGSRVPFGGSGGAIASLEAEHVAGPASNAAIQFQRD